MVCRYGYGLNIRPTPYIKYKENKKINREDANEILGYVAQEILSPMAFDERPASKVWEELTGTKFNTLCAIVNSKITLDK